MRLLNYIYKVILIIQRNCLPPTFPDGLSIEIMRWQILQEAWQMAYLPSQREHVTLYIYKNPKYKLGNFRNNIDLSSLRWTVDHDEDFEFVKKIYESLYPNKLDFSMADILDILKRIQIYNRLILSISVMKA